jgi:hypothetical protein
VRRGGYIDADLRDTATILTGAARLLDFTKPVAVTLLSILHAIPDSDDPWAIVAALLEAVPPGSYVAISTSGGDLVEPGLVPVDEWRADPGTTGEGNSAMWAGVGRKP